LRQKVPSAHSHGALMMPSSQQWFALDKP